MHTLPKRINVKKSNLKFFTIKPTDRVSAYGGSLRERGGFRQRCTTVLILSLCSLSMVCWSWSFCLGQGVSFDPTATPMAEGHFSFESNWTEVLFPEDGDVVETPKHDLQTPTFTFAGSRVQHTYTAPRTVDVEKSTVDTMMELNPIMGTLKAKTDADLSMRPDLNVDRVYTSDYELSWDNFFLVEDEISFNNFDGVVRTGIKLSGAIANRLEQWAGGESALTAESDVEVSIWLYDRHGQLDKDEFQSESQPIEIFGSSPTILPQNLVYGEPLSAESEVAGLDTLRVYSRYKDSGKLAVDYWDTEFVNLETDHEFQNTLIYTLDFFDQSGKHLPDMPYTSALGINYQSAITPVPEPSGFLSLVFVLTTVCVLRCAKRYIRRANAT